MLQTESSQDYQQRLNVHIHIFEESDGQFFVQLDLGAINLEMFVLGFLRTWYRGSYIGISAKKERSPSPCFFADKPHRSTGKQLSSNGFENGNPMIKSCQPCRNSIFKF